MASDTLAQIVAELRALVSRPGTLNRDPVIGYQIGCTDIADRLERLSQSQQVAPARAEWLPIESAPKDGTSILGYREGYKRVTVWWFYNNRWSNEASYHSGPWNPPTHWQPLPDPPQEHPWEAVGTRNPEYPEEMPAGVSDGRG